MKLSYYTNLIKAMPVNNQAFSTNRKTWKSLVNGKFLDRLFGNNETIKISRKELFALAKKPKDLEKFIYFTLFWGYVRGGRGNNIKFILENFKETGNILKSINKNRNIQDISKIPSVKGIGISTLTKFLFFMKIKYKQYNCLILDEKIMNVINYQIFEDLKLECEIKRHNSFQKLL